ncbi:ATP-binding cassette domain-containing protein [Actinophytocola xanthii]|uniref:ABC transporter n=1 Tax=Actinophytocola xanthii TaxID=1912961 RepID=A0A1Q8CXC8_9PSEU|nr:ABC transporter ATP-binding protein [Actinophytocola xanthii]OLF19009.1 ABC transporter [Actinophytocola xanthii]
MSTFIEADGLTLRYDDVTAVDGVSFTLTGGKIYGLLGRNGSGKTSLLSVLAGYRRPSAGAVTVGGRPVFENAEVTRQICLVRGSGDAAVTGLKVRDVLDFAGIMRESWNADYAAELVELFELPLKKNVGALSHGRRSALGIVIGLASRTPVTMFDESYLGLDAPSRYKFYDALLAEAMAHPRTMIVSTHLIEEVSALFEEVLILDEGRLVLHDEAEVLRGAGSAVTGDAELVDRFVAGMRVLGEKRLGRTKSAMVYGELDDERRAQASAAGLDLGPLALQDLFVHLTEPTGDRR